MVQDNNGFLWFGTARGLFKYNGFQYTAYYSYAPDSNSISSDMVECLAADKQGYIWIGHEHIVPGLDQMEPLTGICTHFHHNKKDIYSLASDSVIAIMQDHDGAIWVGTKNGQDRLDTKTRRFYHYPHKENDPASLSCNQPGDIYKDEEGTLWVGTGNASINQRKEGGLNSRPIKSIRK